MLKGVGNCFWLAWLSLLHLLSACDSPAALPTLAPPAFVPAVTEVSDATDLPVTYTLPPPENRSDGLSRAGEGSPFHTNTPGPIPYLPSSTPRPTKTPTPTPTVLATATAYSNPIPRLPPSSELGPSKLGLHVIRNNDPNIMRFVREAQPAVVKAVDDLGFLIEVKRDSPRTTTIGRIDNIEQNYGGNPEEAARDYVNEQLNQYLANPAVDYWEGWNEPDPNLDNMAWYARFEQERVRLLHSYGLRAAIGGFATGVPEMNEFQLFLPAIETAISYGGILSLHEYSAPDMMYLYGAALPGYPAYPDRGALTFRYRWYYREILEPSGLVLPLVISEAGIDGIIGGGRPGPQGYGWADFGSYAVERGWGSNPIEAFINQLAWYDAGVRQDGYVIGFTVFTAGAFGHWKNYDINPILNDLTDYVRSQR
ncbi:MAG TPA: hypothetical protein VF177_05370 [Anaerolineae bacterium]